MGTLCSMELDCIMITVDTGTKMYSLGQDAYCDNANDHTADNDSWYGGGSNAFCQGGSGMNTSS